MLPFLAGLPLALIVAAMIGLRWSAARAAVAGLVVTLLLALAVFGLGIRTQAAAGPLGALAGSGAEALFSAASILWIVLPALALYELQARSGALDRIRAAIGGVTADRQMQVLLVAWFFALFMEGAAGFGTPIALAAPLLVSLGFSPVAAVALPLIGHTAGVSFGAIGTPVFAQAGLSGLGEHTLAWATALLHAILGPMLAVVVVRTAAGGPLRAGPIGWALVASAAFLGPYLLIAAFVGAELPTVGGALAGGLVFAVLLRRRGGGGAPSPDARALLNAALPYAVLVLLILATRLIEPVRQALQSVEIAWTLPGPFRGQIQPLYHPGTMLMAGFLLGGVAQGRSPAELAAALGRALHRLAAVAVALVAMLAVSRLMVHAGMIESLAVAAAGTAAAWPLFAPAVGALGTFVTGSATASNILLTDFQQATARALDLPAAVLAGAQGFGAAAGNAICPHNIIAGGATVGLRGREGEVLARTGPACLGYVAAGGALVLLLVALGG